MINTIELFEKCRIINFNTSIDVFQHDEIFSNQNNKPKNYFYLLIQITIQMSIRE